MGYKWVCEGYELGFVWLKCLRELEEFKGCPREILERDSALGPRSSITFLVRVPSDGGQPTRSCHHQSRVSAPDGCSLKYLSDCQKWGRS
jgi:hypothetical protein